MRTCVVASVFLFLVVAAPKVNAEVTFYATPLAPEASGATGTGSAAFQYDDIAHTLKIAANFSGLSGLTTVAHIHCCVAIAGTGTVGVAVTPGTLPGFPVGVTAGNYDIVVDLTNTASYTSGFLGSGTAADAEASLIAGFDAGKAYLNIHSSTFGGGEIRGFLAEIPEPQGISILLVGLIGACIVGRGFAFPCSC